ncbi:CoA-binding protein [Chloroflexota bacterium]
MLEEKLLKAYRNIAIVGASTNPARPSHQVARYLAEHGYHIIPVNPNEREIDGQKSYPNLSSIPEPVEMVDIFRRPEEVMPIVDEAINIGAKAVWMQLGIVNEEAAARARDAGLIVVMDKCMHNEHQQMMRHF